MLIIYLVIYQSECYLLFLVSILYSILPYAPQRTLHLQGLLKPIGVHSGSLHAALL